VFVGLFGSMQEVFNCPVHFQAMSERATQWARGAVVTALYRLGFEYTTREGWVQVAAPHHRFTLRVTSCTRFFHIILRYTTRPPTMCSLLMGTNPIDTLRLMLSVPMDTQSTTAYWRMLLSMQRRALLKYTHQVYSFRQYVREHMSMLDHGEQVMRWTD
jgi:hypothetical protein